MKSLRNQASLGLLSWAKDLRGHDMACTVRTDAKKIVSRGLGGIFSRYQTSKMEIPVEVCGAHMATSEFWQRASASVTSAPEWAGETAAKSTRGARVTVKLWMILDGITVLGSTVLATLYELHTGPVSRSSCARSVWFLLEPAHSL
jgi:hypothetical protein